MALNKLYYVYGIDTACLYTDEEREYDEKMNRARLLIKKIESKKADYKKKFPYNWEKTWKNRYKLRIGRLKKYIKYYKTELKKIFLKHLPQLQLPKERL